MNRRGYSLTELLVVMSMTSVIFTVGMGMVHRVMHEQKFASRDNVMHCVAERLSSTLREDVHRATAAELFADVAEQSLELNLPSQKIVTYTVRTHEVVRVSTTVDGGPTHRNRFQFPDNYRLEFSEEPSERVVFTAFALPQDYLNPAIEDTSRATIEGEVRRAVMQVEVSVGRDYRFLKETGSR